jgi:serine/threonine protein kinase
MQKRTPLPKGTVLQGRYRLRRRLGSGGMGAVYEAEDVRLKNRLVALKETFADTDGTRQAFEREAELLANTEHEAFPRVIDYFTEMEGCFLVMELIRGEDLAEILSQRSQPFEPEEVFDWTDQILDALEDLHSQNVIHRDIKPANLKLTPRGRIKLLDFGIAKGNAGDPAITTVGSVAATLQYAPIEQVLRADANFHALLAVSFGEKVEEIMRGGTDARTDLYALGATAYQLLTKRLPKNAPTRAAALWSGQPDTLLPLKELTPKISTGFSNTLSRALEVEREKRPVSAAAMRKLLHHAHSDSRSSRDASRQAKISSAVGRKIASPAFKVAASAFDGKIKINVGTQILSSEIPKFETLVESNRTAFVVASLILSAVFVLSVWFLIGARAVSVVSGSEPQSTQQNAVSEKETKIKTANQTKSISAAKNRTKQSLANAKTASENQPGSVGNISANTSLSRPRKAPEKIEAVDDAAPDRF